MISKSDELVQGVVDLHLPAVWHIYRYHTGIGPFFDYKPVVLVSGIESGIAIL